MRIRAQLLAFTVLALTRVTYAVVTERCSFEDGCVTLSNPGCGVAGGGWSTLETNRLVSVSLTKPNQTKLWSLQRFSKGYVYNGQYENYTNKVQNYCGAADLPLNGLALDSIRSAFASCRAAGGTVIPRFAYTWDGYGGCEPDDFDMVVTHVRQLAQVVSEYADVIPAVECGMIGAYGEMHTSRYCSPEYANRIIGAWLKGTPSSIRLLVRTNAYVIRYFGAETKTEFWANASTYDQSELKRIGLYNDGYLGTDGDYGTWGGGSTVTFTREEGLDFLSSRGDIPYGGEFATISSDYLEANVTLFDPEKYNLVREWYLTHLSYLRTFQASDMTIFKKLKSLSFNAAVYAAEGLPSLDEYEGTDLLKFAEDHAGFRFVVRDLLFERGERSCRIELTLENTGFGKLLFPETKEILIVGVSGSFVVTATGTDLRTIDGGTTAKVSIDFTMPAGLVSDNYRIYLRERVPLADETGETVPRRAIAFANAQMYDASLKANLLCSFTYDIQDAASPFASEWFAVDRSSTTERVTGGQWEPSDRGCRLFRPDIASPVGGFVRWRGEIPVVAYEGLPDFSGRGDLVSLALCTVGDGVIRPYAWCGGHWWPLQGWTGVEAAGAELEAVFDFAANNPSVRFALDGIPLRTATGGTSLPLTGSGRQLLSVAFDAAEALGSFEGIYWMELEKPIELEKPRFGGGGAGVGLVGTGNDARFVLTVSNPIAGAYYTTFAARTLQDAFVSEGTSVLAGAGDAEGLLLNVTKTPDASSKFVRVIVSNAPIAEGTELK